MSDPLAILSTGLVTSVGLSASASCAAIRAKLTNPTETRFMASSGKWIMAHQVPLDTPWRGLDKLAHMAAMAIDEALEGTDRTSCHAMPLLLCVAELDRPGRLAGLDTRLFEQIQQLLGLRFGPDSIIVAQGRIGVPVALAQARQLLAGRRADNVLVVAVDSLLTWATLEHYQSRDRLLTDRNSNGFIPGEAAGALCVGISSDRADEFLCTGIGFGMEAAHINSEAPLHAEGLTQAIKAALTDAGARIEEMAYRITDISGEQYYFKEATLALSRTLRVRKVDFDVWHPAECTGEIGAASAMSMLCAAQAACTKGYGHGDNILIHMASDAGQRAAITLTYRAMT